MTSRTRATFAVLVPALLALGLGAACGDPKNPAPKSRLEGSLGQVMDLGYDEARVLLSPTDVALLFVRIKKLEALTVPDGGMQEEMAGVSEDYPIKVAYQLMGETLDGGSLDLSADAGSNQQRGVLSRNVQGDPRNTLPRILRGELIFDRQLDPGATVTGNFHVTFENGIDVASGRTVFTKAFTAQVQP